MPRQIGCVDFRSTLQLDRRSFVKAGVLGATGLTLAQLLQNEARANETRRPSVIILWMRGGPSHIDMWDPKPDAPAEYRGEFGVMNTNVPGVLLSDMLPMIRFASPVIRPGLIPTRTSIQAAAPSSRGSSAICRRTCPRT
jgi:hypothetical protein